LSLLVFDAAADTNRFLDLGEPWEIKKMYAPAMFTHDRIRTIHQAMLERTGSSPYDHWIEMMETRPMLERDITRVDVTGYVEQSREALRAHRTQIDPDGHWFQVPTELVEEVYPWEDFELMASRVGWNADENDLFAGIDGADWSRFAD